MNFFAFHIGDYAVDMRYATLLEDLAYRRLLDLYYSKERPPEGTPESIAEDIGMRDQVTEVGKILAKFFKPQGDVWHHTRCDEEIAKAKAAAERARKNGQGGGRPAKGEEKSSNKKPKNNPVGSDQDISGGPEESNSKAPNPNPNPSSSVADATGGEPPIDFDLPTRIGEAIDPLPDLFPPSDGPPPHPLPDTVEEMWGDGPPPRDEDDEPRIPPKKQAFDEGKAFLAVRGIPPKAAGAFLIGICNQIKDDVEFLRIVQSAVREQALDPRSFMTAAVQYALGQRPDRHGNRAVGKLPPRSAYRHNPDDRDDPHVPF